jgi:hypothetical protein
VKHDAKQTERVRAIEFIDERVDGLITQRRCGSREVDQIAAVRHGRRDFGCCQAVAKAADFIRVERRRLPAVRVPREDLQRLAAVDDRAVHGLRHAAGDRHVRADSQHRSQA